MSQELADSLKKEFTQISEIDCTAQFMKKGSTHKATILKDTQEGVYVFMNEKACFKVGKAGLKSKARWNSHHYCLNKKSPSTFTKSFISDIDEFKKYFEEETIQDLINFPLYLKNIEEGQKLTNEERKKLRTWIENNTDRMEFKLENNNSLYALDLLEKYIAFKLEPMYEGKS